MKKIQMKTRTRGKLFPLVTYVTEKQEIFLDNKKYQFGFITHILCLHWNF